MIALCSSILRRVYGLRVGRDRLGGRSRDRAGPERSPEGCQATG